jgi:DNA-binding CsgD family transcriptional regulator
MLMGLILIDRKLQPVYANPVAESILRYHPAINIRNNRIYAHNPGQSEKIRKALVSAVASAENPDLAESSTMLGLRHPDCATTLPILISPAHRVLHQLTARESFAHAVICLSDPDRSHPIEINKLAAAYKLSRAEAEVAASISNGLTTDEIANINHVSISTVRSQLKSVFRKMAINHQTELVKVLLTGPFHQCM